MLNDIAIIAASGKLPQYVANYLGKKKIRFIIISIQGITTANFKKKYNLYSLRLGNGRKAIQILKSNSIKNIIFLGGLKKPSLLSLKPDLWSLYKIFSVLFFNKTDDSVLRRVVSIFENEGFNIIGLHDLTDVFFLKKGIYGSVDKLKKKDIQKIRKCVLKTIHWTKSDKGQSVITNNKSLILHENEKGTDNLIKRLLKNKKLNENSYLFIKINKIHQDKRIDLPTIGYKTVNYLVKSNIKYIILQADSTIILNKKKIFKLIKKFKKTIISVNINYFPHNNNCYIEF